MGTPRLKILDTYDFFQWVKRSGYTDEMDFWSSLSGIPTGTVVDHMVEYLSSLGYGGTPNDQLAQFLKDQVGLVGGYEGTLYDMANELFDGTFSVSTDEFLLGEDGGFILGEDGGKIILEDGV